MAKTVALKQQRIARSARALIRQINTEEYQFALSIFQREFPPRDQIFISNQTGLDNRQYVRPTIHRNIRSIWAIYLVNV